MDVSTKHARHTCGDSHPAATGARRRRRAVLSDLALSHNNLGLLQSDTEQTTAADQSFQEAIRLQEQLAARDPSEPEHRRNLAASYNNLGGLCTRQDPRRAIESYLVAICTR